MPIHMYSSEHDFEMFREIGKWNNPKLTDSQTYN